MPPLRELMAESLALNCTTARIVYLALVEAEGYLTALRTRGLADADAEGLLPALRAALTCVDGKGRVARLVTAGAAIEGASAR